MRRRLFAVLALAFAFASRADALDFTIVPPLPTSADAVTLGISGVWFDGCVPVLQQVTFEGPPVVDGPLHVRITLVVEPAGGCTSAETAFTVDAALGRLPPGLHPVSVWVVDLNLSNPQPQLLDTTELTIDGFPGEDPTTLLHLHSGRFRVRLDWHLSSGTQGAGRLAPLATADSGVFWFFSSTNWELLFKLLDGCAVNGHYWAIGAGATDVAFDLVVEDLQRGVAWQYEHPRGRLAGGFADVEALPCE
jgi:hypothetical protein